MDWEVRAASLILCLGILLTTIQNGIAERRIVCYYTNWSVYRPGTAKFSPQNINPYLCTHLIYAFGGFTKDNALKPFDKYQDIEKGGYAKFTGLKTYNKNLKTMLAIGGWNEGSSRFSPMVADPARRREFVKNAIKFLRQNHFDGLDLDWEYPAFRDGGKPRDKDNYANLVQELREEFERESSKTGRPRLLLSMAMPAGIEYIDKGYDVPRLNEYLDFINLLSYDYHSAYEPAVNHHSPLYPLEEDNEYNYDAELTIDYTITHLLEKGASADKVVLGIPTYGRSYTLFNKDATELGSPADGPGVEGEATREKGYLAYYEICEGIAESDEWEVVQPNDKAMGPYAFKGDQWVGYDDEDIVKLKSRYVNEKKLGGIMFWSIDNDDFRGKCHGRPYPLIEAAKEALLTDNSRNTIDKTKSGDSRKKIRTQSTQSNARKSGTSGRRSSTTSTPIVSKRVSSSRPNYRTIPRTKTRDEEQEDREVSRRSYEPSSEEDAEAKNTVRVTEKAERPKNRNRSKTRSGSADRNSRRKQSRRKGQSKTDAAEESLSNQLTTPEPPTTPDPGTDFKCEDEGFFPHPRDCKKYFWCLDSGPSGLGVVAHQFTCPSGLVFNKAADSCDYPRNVICPKALKALIVSTTRSPITAATSRTTYLHSTTTAKAESEEYDSEEDYDDESEEIEESEEEEVKEEPRIITTAKPLVYKTLTRNRPSTTTTTTTTTSKSSEPERFGDSEDEEDPRVIKELIDLIKKAGGIEQLEKQLLFQEKNFDTKLGSESVTPATISRSLYERVLSRQANRIASQRPIFSSSETSYVNGPGRAQFEGLDDIPEVKSLRRSQKPQYVTIERPKSVTKESPSEDEDIDDENEEDNADVASSEDETISSPLEGNSSTQRVTPNYVNIRRSRPSTTTSRIENDVGDKELEEIRPTRRRRPSTSSKQQDNETSSETSKPFRNRGSGYRNSEKGDDWESADRSAEEDNGSSTAKSRYINIQRFRSTTLKSSEDLSNSVPSAEVVNETTPATNLEERPEVRTTTSTITLSSTTPRPTTSTSTEIITVISVEPPENPSSVRPKVVDTVSTTDSVKLVDDSATEILLTTLPAPSSGQSTTTTTTTTTLPSRTTVAAAVSQPRPFGFTRRRPGPSEATTTASTTTTTTPSSRSKVADSKVIRLPTLRELIGYPTTYYDDYRINTSPSSILLHLLRNDVDNDISRQNVVKKESFGGTNELQDDEKVLVQLPRNVNEETGDSWLRQASENKVRSRSPKQEDIIGNIDERVSVTNAIREDEREQKKLSTSMYLKPTTMRGIPLASLTPNPVTRGFYVTRSENDLISQTSVRNFTSSYTTESLIEQQTETTLTLDISTTDESFTIAQNDQNGSISQISNDDVNDIVTDETATIVSLNDQNKLKFNNPDGNINGIINNKSVDTREEKYSGSSVISSEDSDNDENISDYEETDVIIAPVSRSTSKRRKSLRNFDSNTTPLSNAHVFSSTTPTRRKIALVVRKYNEATTPLWTARRVVARKRSRTTVSPIKDAIKQAESNSIRAITNIKSASTIPAIVTFRKRKRPATSTIPTIPLIMSESITSSKIFNIRDDLANSTDTKNDDPISHITGEEMITTTDSQNAAQITSTTDNPTTIITSTILNDPTTLTIHKIPSASIITTTPSTVAVAETPTDATDAIIMTTYATMSAGIETTFVATNYSVIPIPAIIHANDSVVRSASTNIGAETTSVIANYSTDFIDTTPVTTDVTASTGVETTFAITNNSIVTSKIADTNTIVTDSTDTFATTDTEIETTSAIANSRVVIIPETVSTQAVTTDPAITTTPVTTNTGIEIISIMTNHSVVATPTVDAHESATDFTDMTTEKIASIEVDTTFTTANYSMVTIPVTLNTPDVVTNPTITTTLAPANTEIETTSTIANYSATIPETTNTHATTPISATTITPLTTVISSTTDTHTYANTPMITVDLADTDTLVTDTITVTTPANVIVPTTDSDVITTPSSTSIPHSNTTSPIIDTFTTTTQSRTISTNPSKAPITSTDTTSTTPTTLTDESSTVHFINPNIIDVSGKLLTAIAESTQTTEMSTTFEISPTSTTIAISEFLPNTNSEISSALTTSLSTQTDESSVTMTTQTPSTLLSLLTPITNTVTVGLEKSTVSSALPATSSESIATNFVIQTFASTYEPDSMRITNKESTTPELIGLEKDTSRATQNRAESRATTSIYESSNTRTMSEESTTPELKINLEKATSWIAQSRTESRTTTGIYEPSTARMTSEPMTSEMKVNSTENTLDGIQIRRQNQTTSEPDTTGYQFGEKTFQRRVINRTKNWNGRPVAQQTINQYPRRRITVYRGRPRRPPNTSSSKIVEQNRRRRIMQRRVRVNSKAVNSTITPESIVRNITEDHTDRLENTRRRMKVVLKRVREKVEEETTTLLPIKETTTFSQSSTENETLPIYHANGNIDRKRKVLKRIRPQPQENVVKEEISINPDSNSERHSDNSQNDSLGVHEDLLQQEKMKKRMRVVLKSIRPKSEGKNLIKETNVDSDIIDEYLQNNFSRNPHTDENLPDKGNTRRRMRVVLKSVKPKSNEKNPTIEETNADSHVTVKNLQDTFVNNLNTSTNLPDEEKTRGRKRIILKRVRPKSEEGETTTKEATTDLDSTEETLQGTFSNNFRENLPVEYKTRRRMRVVLKNIKPITEERISTGEEADVDSDSTNKDLQGSFSSNFHENFSDKEKTRIRTEVIPSNNKSIFKETDSIAEETNTDSEFTKKDPRVLYTFNFSSNLQVGGNLPDKEKTTRSNSEEEEATTGQPKDTELLITGTPVVLVDEDTDRPSLEATSSKNSGPVRRQPGSGNSSRQRKPTQSTTIVPPTNTLPSTSTTQRRRRPTESTLSSRIDHFVDAFEGTEPYTKLTTTENDQEADVSDQSIHAQEFAVTLADPPSSSSDTGRTTLKDSVGRKISTTIAPRTGPATSTTVSRYGADYRNRQRSKTIDRPTINVTTRPRKPPVIDYDYYEDEVPIVIGKSVLNSKLFLTSKGTIHCLDQGNFPHPYSCKKFITCARMVNGQVIGTEYTCPAKLSFDPVGGICNWSAGLGCKD